MFVALNFILESTTSSADDEKFTTVRPVPVEYFQNKIQEQVMRDGDGDTWKRSHLKIYTIIKYEKEQTFKWIE